MFEYSLLHWLSFFAAAFLLVLSPGPDIAYILAQTLRYGRRTGFIAMFGLWTGAFVHVLLAAAGLSAVLATSATAFNLVKWLGALYLIYLGLQSLRASSGFSTVASEAVPAKLAAGKVYQQGILVCLFNPKVAVFFLSFLPQFVVTGAGPVSAQLLLHGSLVIFVAAFVEPLVVVLGAKLGGYFAEHSLPAKIFDCLLGVVLIALGLQLGLSAHNNNNGDSNE